MTTLVSKRKGAVNESCELTSFILPAGVLLLSAMNDVAAQRADPTPLDRRRLGLAPWSSRVSTACKNKYMINNDKQLLFTAPWPNRVLERFSYDLEMKTREQNRNNKRTEI